MCILYGLFHIFFSIHSRDGKLQTLEFRDFIAQTQLISRWVIVVWKTVVTFDHSIQTNETFPRSKNRRRIHLTKWSSPLVHRWQRKSSSFRRTVYTINHTIYNAFSFLYLYCSSYSGRTRTADHCSLQFVPAYHNRFRIENYSVFIHGRISCN